ncbi:SH3 domain-binding glutamic acid-rich -like protein [Trichinella pseudospiralis]|uniref:SH3 domain-binding glutamic acid-rich-like protein n=1 Tax=Trichinella pseudospiralis TaxID=6337 RepID=A0A0V1IBP5_TRIPS|nr:SH3 domain-binding glutamic acid-rich -like protein [Trichinella pseudospiralis]KRZ42918.1 SH3 domain-binding glutamic acid-rich -like protein [Trichinella pseudospiralis]
MSLAILYSSLSPNLEFKKHTQHVIMVLDAMRVSYELFDLCDLRDCNKKEKYKEVCASKRNGQLWFPQIFFGEDYCGDYEDFAEAIESNKLNTFLKLAPSETSAINEQEVLVKNVDEDDSGKPSATTASNGHDDGDVLDEEAEDKVEDSEGLQKSTHEGSADDSDDNFDRGVSSEALEEEVNNKESDKLENTADENDDEDDQSKSGMHSSVENSSDNECLPLKEEHVDEKSIREEEDEGEEEEEEEEEEEPEESEKEEEKDDEEEDEQQQEEEEEEEEEETNDKVEKEAEKEELDNVTEEEAEDELEVEDDEERSDSE